MSISRENEFGDKNNLEISLKRALFGAEDKPKSPFFGPNIF